MAQVKAKGCLKCCGDVIVVVHNPLLLVGQCSTFRGKVDASGLITYDENVLVNPNLPLSPCDIKMNCCVSCDTYYIDDLRKTLADWYVDGENAVKDIRPEDDVFSITFPIVDRITGNQITTFTCDFSSLFDDTTVTYIIQPDPANPTGVELVGSDGNNTQVDLCPLIRPCLSGAGDISYDATTGVISFTETHTTFNINPDGSITYTNEDGVVTTSPASSAITNTTAPGNLIATHTANGVVSDIYETITSFTLGADGESIEFTDEAGNTTNLNLCAIVDSCETVTALAVGVDGESLDFTDEDGNINNVPLCPVVQSCETVTTLIFNPLSNELTYTREDGTQDVILIPTETLTTLVVNPAGEGLIYTDEDGNANAIDLCPIVQNCETVTNLMYDQNTGALTYQKEDGTQDVIILPVETFLQTVTYDPATNVLDFMLTNGTTFQVNLTDLVDPNVLTSLQLVGTELRYTDENLNVNAIDLCPVVEACETITTLDVDNAAGTATYTNEAGDAVTFQTGWTTAVVNGDGSTTLTYPDGTVVTLPAAPASDPSSITNTVVGNRIASHDNGDGVVVDINETITTATLNGDGSVTLVNEVGTVTVIPAPSAGDTSVVTNVQAGNLIASHDDGSGTVVNINETITTMVVNADGSVTYTNEAGAVSTIPAPVATNPSEVTNTVPGNIIATHNDGTGTIVNINETITVMTVNADGSVSYTNEDGDVTIIPAPAAPTNPSQVTGTQAGNTIGVHDNGDGVLVDINETITTMVINADGSVTFTNEAGTVSTIPAPAAGANDTSVVVPVVTGQTIATHADGSGAAAVNIQETITTAVVNADGSVTLTNEAGTVTTIPAPAAGNTSSVVEGPAGTFTHDDGQGNTTVWTLPTDTNDTSVMTGNTNGIASHDDGTGTTVAVNITDQDADNILTDDGGGTKLTCADVLAAGCYSAGTNITIAADGTISAAGGGAGGSTSVVTGTQAGNTIATHADGNGTSVDINESDTPITDNNNGTYSYTSESGTATTIDTCNVGGTLVDCTLTLPSCVGADKVAKVMPETIKADADGSNDLVSIVGFDAGECPVAITAQPCEWLYRDGTGEIGFQDPRFVRTIEIANANAIDGPSTSPVAIDSVDQTYTNTSNCNEYVEVWTTTLINGNWDTADLLPLQLAGANFFSRILTEVNGVAGKASTGGGQENYPPVTIGGSIASASNLDNLRVGVKLAPGDIFRYRFNHFANVGTNFINLLMATSSSCLTVWRCD